MNIGVLTSVSVVTELTRHIMSKEDKRKSDLDENLRELNDYFPEFLWLVRDFMLQLEHDGNEIDAKEYLEIALRVINQREVFS